MKRSPATSPAGSLHILSTRQQSIADHSSTSYYFYAAKPLTQEARSSVNTLSSHVDVGSRTAEITYHGDFADLGETRREKFLEYYDVEVRESYDWWTLCVMLEPEKVAKLPLEDYTIESESSLTFAPHGKRLCLCFDGWHQDYGAAYETLGEGAMKELAKLGRLRLLLPSAGAACGRIAGARGGRLRDGRALRDDPVEWRCLSLLASAE